MIHHFTFFNNLILQLFKPYQLKLAIVIGLKKKENKQDENTWDSFKRKAENMSVKEAIKQMLSDTPDNQLQQALNSGFQAFFVDHSFKTYLKGFIEEG